MSTFEVTYADGSMESFVADQVFESELRIDFVRFVGGGQERFVSRDRKLVLRVEQIDE